VGFLWDLIQHSQIREQSDRTGTLESRVRALEEELAETRRVLSQALTRIEQRLGEDLDRDGKVG
jgi:uncharacterized protein involved in exopolysaccharide biosynthesis